jgi:hypothetical protein
MPSLVLVRVVVAIPRLMKAAAAYAELEPLQPYVDTAGLFFLSGKRHHAEQSTAEQPERGG